MTAQFALGALAEQRHVLPPRQFLDQAQREFLAMVLDRLIPGVKILGKEKLLLVSADIFLPANLAGLPLSQQGLARTQAGHPDVITTFRNTTAAKPAGQDAEAVAGLNRRMDRFGF